MRQKLPHKKTAGRQITLRGMEPQLEDHLLDVARREGLSLNRVALRLLRQGAGLAAPTSDTIGDRLDDLIGSWSKAEARAFDTAVQDFSRVDESFWR